MKISHKLLDKYLLNLFFSEVQSRFGISQYHVEERHPRRVPVENEFMVIGFNTVYHVSLFGNNCGHLQIDYRFLGSIVVKKKKNLFNCFLKIPYTYMPVEPLLHHLIFFSKHWEINDGLSDCMKYQVKSWICQSISKEFSFYYLVSLKPQMIKVPLANFHHLLYISPQEAFRLRTEGLDQLTKVKDKEQALSLRAARL